MKKVEKLKYRLSFLMTLVDGDLANIKEGLDSFLNIIIEAKKGEDVKAAKYFIKKLLSREDVQRHLKIPQIGQNYANLLKAKTEEEHRTLPKKALAKELKNKKGNTMAKKIKVKHLKNLGFSDLEIELIKDTIESTTEELISNGEQDKIELITQEILTGCIDIKQERTPKKVNQSKNNVKVKPDSIVSDGEIKNGKKWFSIDGDKLFKQYFLAWDKESLNGGNGLLVAVRNKKEEKAFLKIIKRNNAHAFRNGLYPKEFLEDPLYQLNNFHDNHPEEELILPTKAGKIDDN